MDVVANMHVTLKLYATLTDYLPPAARRKNAIDLELPEGTTIETLTTQFNLPGKLSHLVLVNGVFVARSERGAHRLNDGDVVSIWPPIAGG